MPVVAVLNNKGGVGKTTVVASLSAALARRRHRVLCVDIDPQANLSRRLGHINNPKQPVATLTEALKADLPGCAIDIVTPCRWMDPTAAQIDLLPSRYDLENRYNEANRPHAVQRLVNIMGSMPSRYDFVLIDCPPSLGHLTQMAIVAAGQSSDKRGAGGYGLVVLEAELDAGLGASRMLEFASYYAPRLGVPNFQVKGMIVNRVRPTDLHTVNLADIRETFGPLVWEPVLPLRTVMADAMGAGVPVHTFRTEPARELTSRLDRLAEQMEKS